MRKFAFKKSTSVILALLIALSALAGCKKQNDGADSSSGTTSSSSSASVKTLGPAQTAASATVAKKTTSIAVTWKTVTGAAAYAVRRDRCDITNTNVLSTDIYIVPSSPSSSSVIKANGTDTGSGVTAAASSDGATITLTDTYVALSSSAPTSWQTNQDKISWGFPYRYTVFPLADSSDDFDSDTNTVAGTVTYKNTDNIYAAGSALGYGHDVTATKAEDPNKVTITWTKPWLGTSAASPKLWRTVDGNNDWSYYTDSVDSNGYFIITPTGASRTAAYDYAVTYGSDTPSSTYLAYITATMDSSKSPTEPLNKGYPFAISCTAANVTESGDIGYGEKISWTLWDYTSRAIGPASGAVYTAAIKNANYGSGWNTIATITGDASSSAVALSNNSAYDCTMTAASDSITITPNNMSDTSIHTGLLRVLRDYKHYAELVVTRTNSNGDTITASYADSGVYAYRKISNAEFTKAAMLAITYGFYMAQTGDDADYSEIGSEPKIYSAKSTSGATGTFSYTDGSLVWAAGVMPYKHNFTFGNYAPKQLAESGDSICFMKINSAQQSFYRYELSNGWFKLFYTSPAVFTISCYDSTISEYSGTLEVTCSDRTSISIKASRSNGSSSTFSGSTNDGVHTWFPMRFYNDSKYYINDSSFGWW